MTAVRTLERARQHFIWDMAAMLAGRTGDRDQHSEPKIEAAKDSTPGRLTSYDGFNKQW